MNVDITLNGSNSERFPPIKKNLSYYFPLDETFQCCVQSFKYANILCVRNINAQDGDLYKKFFLELKANVKISYVDLDNFALSSETFSKGKFNAIAIDCIGFTITDEFQKLVRKISVNNQIPIFVLNETIADDVYNVGGVSVLYFKEIPSDEILLEYLEKGIRYEDASSYQLHRDFLSVKDSVTFPIHDNISDFTISVAFRLDTIQDNNLIFSIENTNGKIISIVYDKNKKTLKAEFRKEKKEYIINLDTKKFYRLSITKRSRLFKIYLNEKKIFEYQYDIPIKATEIILGKSGNLGYAHIANNLYKDLWLYNDCKSAEDIEKLSKSVLTMLS